MSLRTKLIIASGGPLLILLIIGLFSISTIARSSKTIERIFRENYDSVAAGQSMMNTLALMDRSAEAFAWGWEENRQQVYAAVESFAASLKFQQGNITLPGEKDLTDRLTKLWENYRSDLESYFVLPETDSLRRDYYRNRLLPLYDEVQETAQQIININLNNMVSIDGQVRQQASETNRTLFALVISGVVLALILIVFIVPSIARPISNLTNSVKEIQQGNLDLHVKVRSGDEIGQLAASFNEMTSSLREFRRSNRARLIRTQEATISALNSLSDGIAVCSPGGQIELSNQTAQTQFALKPGTDIGSIENEKVKELFNRACRQMRPISYKSYDSALQIFKDGEERFFLPEAVPIFDDARRLMGVTLIFSDVSRLRQVDELKSGLISTVSHELKTPLTSIRLATHALLNEKLGLLNPKQTELVAAAREDSDRLYRIIENLLDIGRMEAERSNLQLIPVNTGQILLNAVEVLRPSFNDKGIALLLDLPPDIPDVLADRFRLEIVFTNLLSNALKNTPPGGQVKVSARMEKGRVLFRVEDSGKGISQEYLPHIFDKFFRVPGYSQQGDSGLGLAIVKEIVEAHRSRIEAFSNPGEGTAFLFSLAASSGPLSRQVEKD